MGEIVTTHGIRGWLKVNPHNPETTLFTAGREVFLESQGSRAAHEIESSKTQGRQILIKLRGVDSIEQAKNWVGFRICAAESALPALPPGEYYQYQAIGLEVVDLQGRFIGTVTGIWKTAGGDLYVVSGPEKEHLVPAVKEIIEKVDLTAGKMIINPPEGLLDL